MTFYPDQWFQFLNNKIAANKQNKPCVVIWYQAAKQCNLVSSIVGIMSLQILETIEWQKSLFALASVRLLIPIGGNAWIITDVILSKSWNTRLFLQVIIAHNNGPLLQYIKKPSLVQTYLLHLIKTNFAMLDKPPNQTLITN